MNRVLVINIGWEQQPLLLRLAERGYDIYGVHYTNAREGNVELADLHICDLRDLSSISEYSQRVQPDMVISDQCDYSHFAQAVVSEQLGLPGPSIEAAQVSSNKFLQRSLSQELGVDVPAFRLCKSPVEAQEAAKEIGYPVVLKPVDNRGSFGVNKVSVSKQIRSAYWDALLNSHSRFVLVEEFIEGVHITVDGYAFPKSGCRSVALATKTLLGDSARQVATDIIYPGELPDQLCKKAMKVNETVNKALGYEFGMTHSEYMVTDEERIVLIESANRGGGCFTSEIIAPNVSGIDLTAQLIAQAEGDLLDLYQEPQDIPTILKFITLAPGTVSRIDGLTDARDQDGTLALRLQVQEGTEIQSVTTDADRHGFIIYSADAEVRKGAVDALDLIKVTYEGT